MGVSLAFQRVSTVPEPTEKRFVFLLLDSFAALDFNCAVEALSAANSHRNAPGFSWLVLSESGRSVAAANGVSLNVDGPLQELNRQDTIVVCGGENIAATSTLNVLNWLRREARKGVTCGSIGTATHTLAVAGLLRDTRITTHWGYHAVLEETFPELQLDMSIYAISNTRFTCAGGISTLDMMLEIISQTCGHEIATYVADRLVCSAPRTGRCDQTMSILCRTGNRNEKLAAAVEIMQKALENPLSPSEISLRVGLSTRQLERLFSRYLHITPKSYYTKLRLENARSLLQKTNMKVIDVAFASGFNSTSHFSRLYKNYFGTTPYAERGVPR